MMELAVSRHGFWVRSPGFCPESADSAPRANSGFWLFRFDFSGLECSCQNPECAFRILFRSLEVLFRINALEQISESGKLPPKGVGDLPARRGRVTTYPWAISRAVVWPHSPTEQQAGKEPLMAHMSLTPTPVITPPPAVPVVLALDLGTTTGWALQAADGLITSGTVSFRPSRYDGGGMRYLRFRGWLDQLTQDAGLITAIHFEEVRRHAGTDAAHVYGGLLATLTAWAETAGIAYQGVPVSTIKRHATGKGNANKDAMMAAARARGFSPTDDNEADAIAILLWALETRGGVQ